MTKQKEIPEYYKGKNGYMAKDVEKFIPEAVGEEAGYQTLDYAMVADFINAGGLDG